MINCSHYNVAQEVFIEPHLAGYLLHRGLQTLNIRVKEAQKNAIILANRLQEHTAVERVFHPSLPSCDPQQLVGKQMSGPGALMAINLHGDLQFASRVMQRLQVLTPAVSLGSVETLIQHPAGLTHRNSSASGRTSSGITDSMLRISIGIECVEDLWNDLKQALDGE